jgi:hypothetical protein
VYERYSSGMNQPYIEIRLNKIIKKYKSELNDPFNGLLDKMKHLSLIRMLLGK